MGISYEAKPKNSETSNPITSPAPTLLNKSVSILKEDSILKSSMLSKIFFKDYFPF